MTRSVGMVMLVLLCGALPAVAQQPCKPNLSLKEATNVAAEFVKAKDFVVAITDCYEPFYKEYFGGGRNPEVRSDLEDRFLAEYIDACLLATLEQRISARLATIYYQRVLALADRYFQDFGKETNKPSPQRAQTVVSNLIAASIKLGKQSELLDTLEQYSLKLPEAFRPALLNEWEKLLKSDPAYQRELTNSEIRDRIDKEPEYRDRWSAYADFLREFGKVENMRAEARRRLARLPRVSIT